MLPPKVFRMPSLAWRRWKWRVPRRGLSTRAESSGPNLSFHKVGQHSCKDLACTHVGCGWRSIMLYIITFRLLEESPLLLTLPLLTSDNNNPDSETGRANSHFGMMPQYCSHIVDTWADSNCIHQLMLTASLAPYPVEANLIFPSLLYCGIVILIIGGSGVLWTQSYLCKNLGIKEGEGEYSKGAY